MLNSIENELIIITKQTFDAFLNTDIPADLIALYMFYYYTAKWQGTNQPKCTTTYTAKALKWAESKVRKAKKELVSFGFIEDIQQKNSNNGKVTGHYIKLNYIMKESNIHPYDFPQCGTTHSVEQSTVWNSPQCGKSGDKCLKSNNINALRDNNLNALRDNNLNALNKNCSANTEVDKVPYTEIVDFFNETCKSFPQVRSLSKERKGLLNARFKEFGLDGIKEAFTKAEQSDFLKGKINNFKANFDWIIKPSNMCKVLEGNYDNRKSESNTNNGKPEYDEKIYGEMI